MSDAINTEVVTETVTETNPEVSTNVSTNVETSTEVITETKTETVPEVKTETKSETKPVMIPKERFDEVNTKYKELAGQVAEMLKAKEVAEQTATSLTTDSETLKGKVEHYETLMKGMVEVKISAIPEEMKDLIPEGLSTEQTLSWLSKAEEKGLFVKQVKQVEIGQPLNHSNEQNQEERMKKMNPLQLMASYYGGGQ